MTECITLPDGCEAVVLPSETSRPPRSYVTGHNLRM